MPGRPKSCATCQIRKVKCNRALPACSQCIKYCWTCPGYPTIKSKSDKRQPVKDYQSITSRSRRQSNASQHRQEDLVHLQCAAKSKSVPRVSIFLSPDFLASSVAKELVSHLASRTSKGQSLSQLGSFIHLVPARLGTNDALDAAVKCLCSAYSTFISSNTPVDQSCYFRALKSVRQCLANGDTALSSELLGAIVCLSWSELLRNNLVASWMVHTSACAKLIQLRGPDKHLKGFGRALLHAEHGLIICDAFIQQEPSFLNAPGWENVIEAPLPNVKTDLEIKLLINNFKLTAKLAALRSEIKSLLTGKIEDEKAFSIHQRLLSLREECKVDLRLASKQDSPDQNLSSISFQCDNLTVLFCKGAMGHIFVNLALLEFYNKCSTLLPLEIPQVVGSRISSANHNSWNSLKLSEDHLNVEITGLFELAQSNFHKAYMASPLGWRRMASTYHTICVQARKSKDYHPIWDQIHGLVHKNTMVDTGGH